MSDLEFDVLDELYFVQPYEQLRSTLSWDDDMLRDTLEKLLDKGWIRCYINPSEEIFKVDIDFEISYRNYFYLASKAGLFAHNSIDHDE
ncbi:MAG: hypothetical protein KFF73_18490 [Cyclobacteriaceae bacterium]|nr:hypothetical protein [Cyclobacteriaceae bacterium]